MRKVLARQMAVRFVQSTGAQEGLVNLCYFPGMQEPAILAARIDGEEWGAVQIHQAIQVPDLSIEGSFQELILESVKWREVLVRGYFGNNWAWDN